MTIKGLIASLTQQEDLNFLLTNRIPRAAVTRFMGWFSQIENPLVCAASIACWRLFSDLDLSEAKKTEFKSLHDCFTRELKEGLRPFDQDQHLVASPSDAIIGAYGAIEGTDLFQIKGANYSLKDLLGDDEVVERHRNGRFITLRLTSSMYHRFHAPADFKIERVTFISGDTWNVNPIALKRVERLFCKNERAVIETRLTSGEALTIEQGALYPALYRLEHQGLLQTEWGTSDNNRRAKYYSLTGAGRKRLREETASWNRLATAIGSALAAQPEEV